MRLNGAGPSLGTRPRRTEKKISGMSSGHLKLNAFAHLIKRSVKVIQPGLLNFIEWRTCTWSRFRVVGYRTGPDEDFAHRLRRVSRLGTLLQHTQLGVPNVVVRNHH